MLNNSYKMIFFFSMIFGSLITMSSTSWISMWMGLEINLLSFIPLMMSSKNLFSSEASLKYFFTQVLASSVFLFFSLFFLVFFNFFYLMKNMFFILIIFSMLMKMGSAPFHFWFPSVIEGLNWTSSFLLMTWQKIAPLMIFSYLIDLNFLMIFILLSALFGSLGGLNQSSLRKLMAFSSINHLSWMMASLIYSELYWSFYFLFYSFLNFNIIWIFHNLKLMNLNQIFYFKKNNFFINMFMFLTLFSLGGLPPFLGFFPKWILIEMLTLNKMMLILIFLLMCSLITLFFYIRISFNSLLLMNLEMSWNFKNFYKKKMNKMILLLTFISLTGLLMINLFFNLI